MLAADGPWERESERLLNQAYEGKKALTGGIAILIPKESCYVRIPGSIMAAFGEW